MFTSIAVGQTQVNTSGRLMDANPAVGGYRFNDARPATPWIGGNPYASGNVRGGLSLRSFETIGDPMAFRGTLGTSTLSDFLRDSVSVGDVYVPNYGRGPAPFYDPATTVPNVGLLSNQYRSYSLGQGQPGGSANRLLTLPGMLSYGGPISPPPVAPRVNTALIPQSSAGSAYMPAPIGGDLPGAAGLFGVTAVGPRAPQAIRPLDPTNPVEPTIIPRTLSPVESREQPSSPAHPSLPTTRLDLRQITEPIGAPLDTVLRGDAAALLEARRPDPLVPPREIAGGPSAKSSTESPIRLPSLRDTSMLPGNDVFTDMRLALSLSKDPTADWWTEMQSAADQTGTGTREAQARSAMEAQEFLNRVMKAPVKSFVGEGHTPVNDELLKAEGLLRIGQYYDAAARFQQAHMLDPTNPLPLIGRGHALLAAGDYLSAAIQLVRGFERFPDMARFEVDLRSFLGSGEIIDIRRSDIMKQLDRNEDAQLRFLLGYLEYYTGDKPRGLENLDRAAESADVSSLIRRFPDMLRGVGVLPPPKLNVEPTPPVDSTKEPIE
jgi:hypothetical protein